MINEIYFNCVKTIIDKCNGYATISSCSNLSGTHNLVNVNVNITKIISNESKPNLICIINIKIRTIIFLIFTVQLD